MATSRRVPILLAASLLALPVALVLGVVALDADVLEDTVLGRAFVPRAEPRNPVAVAAEGLFAERDVRLNELRTRIEEASSHQAVLELEREYEQVKLQTELDLLRLQLDHARSTGNTRSTERLEAAVASMEHVLDRLNRRRDLDHPASGR